MASRNLGTLTLDLVAKIGGFVAGMDKAARESEKRMKKMKKDTDALSDSFLSLGKRLAGPVVAALGLQKLQQYADEWTNINNRLKLVTDSTAELAIAQQAVFGIAQDTRQSLASSAELYQRIATNADELGLSLNEVSGVVETISQTLVISGASAQSASAALVQLGQAFASGTLRGEELNSVMEQAPALAKAIAEGLGVSIGQLREMGKAGELTSEQVIGALQKMASSVEADFEKTNGTIGQAFQKLGNSLIAATGQFDEASGASRSFAGAIDEISQAIDRVSQGGSAAGRIRTITESIERLRSERDDGGFWAFLGGPDVDKRIARLTAELIQLRAQQSEIADADLFKFDDVAFDLEELRGSYERAGAGLEKFSANSVKASEDAARAERSRKDGIESTILSLEKQATTIGYTADQLQIYELASEGATKSDLARARAAMATVSVYEDQLEILEQINAENDASFGQFEDELIKGEKDKFEELLGNGKKSLDEMSVYAKRAAENMQDAFADFLFDPFKDGLEGMLANFGKILQRMAAEAAAAQIFDWAKGLGSSTSGSASSGTSGNGTDWASLAASFAGFFDTGGMIKAGQFGIAGENGPEIVSGPAMITSTKDTARMMGGSSVSIGSLVFPGVRTEREAQQASGAAARQLSRIANNNRYN